MLSSNRPHYGDNMNTTDSAEAQAIHNLTSRQRVIAIVSASSGNLVEWFDFYIYSFCALYFSSSFFPKQDPTVQLLTPPASSPAAFLSAPTGGGRSGPTPARS